MKTLLVGEYREGKLLDSTFELFGFANKVGADAAILLIGDASQIPAFEGTIYLADSSNYGEYNPEIHKELVLEALKRSEADAVVFIHSSFGWDLAPRVAASLKISQISEIIDVVDGGYEVGCCNGKMRRKVAPKTAKSVLTNQAGAFPVLNSGGSPNIEKISCDAASKLKFARYEPAEKKDVDLAKAEVIVSAGRGVGKKENVAVIEALAKAFGGELGASRPVVDAGWVPHDHQVGTTGQTVSPKLYVACGISGAIQHLAGMKKSDFILAINKDKDAPIGEIADVLVVTDIMQFAPALMAKLG